MLLQAPQHQSPSGSPLAFGSATEGASVQVDFKFLHHLPEGGAITSSLLANDARLPGAFTHCVQARRGSHALYGNVDRSL